MSDLETTDTVQFRTDDDLIELNVATAIRDDDQYEGLSPYDELEDDEGMLFVWPVNGLHGLVMRDMSFSIDTVFADTTGTVTHTATLEESGDETSAEAKYAVEAPAGFCEEHGISIGDELVIASETVDKTVDEKQDEFGVDVFALVARENADEYEGNVLAIGVDMPNHDIYVDWRLDAWGDDQLGEPHVSIYGSMDDVRDVADGEVEYLDNVSVPAEIGDTLQRGVTKQEEDFARDVIVQVNNTHEAPDNVIVHSHEDIGLYYVDPEGVSESETVEQSEELQEITQALFKVDNITPTSWSGYRPPDEVIENVDRVSEVITSTYKDQIWPQDLSKTERTWSDSDEVPEFVKEWIADVIKETDPIYDDYDGVPALAAMNVQKHIEESLTQPQGWSLASIAKRLEDEFEWMTADQSKRIARQEVAGILNTSKAVALRAAEKEDEMYVFDWVGPDDHNTSHICRAIKADIDEEGGSVSYSELKSILRGRAEQFEQSGGTPHRIEQMLPHFGCRQTMELVDVVDR